MSKADRRDASLEAAAALRFWQSLEYLAPQAPPKVLVAECVWEFHHDVAEEKLPWNDPEKQNILTKQIRAPKKRFQIYAGVLDGSDVIEAARAALGAEPINGEERPRANPAACLMLGVDETGRATGDVFISTVPWAMGVLAKAGRTTADLDFSGFFGREGVEETLQKAVVELLVKRKLLAQAELRAAGASQAAQDDQAGTATGDAANRVRQITAADVAAVVDFVFERCRWRPERQMPWRVAGMAASSTESTPDDPLNSFYAEDLERVHAALAVSDIGAGLAAYLRGEKPTTARVDVDREVGALIDGVDPNRFPPGCWPAKHPLVTAQQFAVNAIMAELNDAEGIFAVNGPPGTGKTTMLKDIVAAIEVKRADALVKFVNPLDAIGTKIALENHARASVYGLASSLRGFGIVVASANNGAVENVTKELPGLGAVDPALQVRYLELVAETIAAPLEAKCLPQKRSRWGMMAAVLGNKGNRRKFANRFWFAGSTKAEREKARSTGPALDPARLRSLVDLIDTGEHQALPWPEARTNYLNAKARVKTATDRVQAIAMAVKRFHAARVGIEQTEHSLAGVEARLQERQRAEDRAGRAATDAQAKVEHAESRHAAATEVAKIMAEMVHAAAALGQAQAAKPAGTLDETLGALADLTAAHESLQKARQPHDARRPGVVSAFLGLPHAKQWALSNTDWDSREKRAFDAIEQGRACMVTMRTAMRNIEAANARVDTLTNQYSERVQVAAELGLTSGDDVRQLHEAVQAARRGLAEARQALQAARAELMDVVGLNQKMRARIKEHQSDMAAAERELGQLKVPKDTWQAWDLSSLDRQALHLASPYFTQEWFDARRQLFVAALALHEAFIVAAWDRLSGPLSAFVDLLLGKLSARRVPDGVMHLWDAFFLVVPVVSTTFASFPRSFNGVGREALAWLLIDEAGQAAPQQAVGAIWRARRSVIVGDPLQLEPVVGVPDELVEPLRLRAGAEKQWVPPKASAQRLADLANRYGTLMGDPDDSEALWLGAPLRVHRRCYNPMFDIANDIAYEGKMVYGTGPVQGSSVVGGNCWIDIPAMNAEGHWIAEQGQCAIDLVNMITRGKLRNDDDQFIVYVVTPFRTVAETIGPLLEKHFGKAAEDMCGTVHTFQGKEAEHVVFLLGGDPKRPGVIGFFAGAKPNLVNVAVTRAKRWLYVIGDHSYWMRHDAVGYYKRMASPLPVVSSADIKARAALVE